MAILHRRPRRGVPLGPFGDDSTFVPLALSLAAFATSCVVLFGLAMSESTSLLQFAVSTLVIAAMGAVSWRLHRVHRRELLRGAARPSARPSPDAPPAAVQRFSELRTTACRHEPSNGKVFVVRCFRVDCPSSLACPKKDTEQPAPQRP